MHKNDLVAVCQPIEVSGANRFSGRRRDRRTDKKCRASTMNFIADRSAALPSERIRKDRKRRDGGQASKKITAIHRCVGSLRNDGPGRPMCPIPLYLLRYAECLCSLEMMTQDTWDGLVYLADRHDNAIHSLAVGCRSL